VIHSKIEYASLDELLLDPTNPRLGREYTGLRLNQEKVLDLMKDWTLDELALSFLEGGFWVQEALLVVREKIYGKTALVVVEGNRRLAALQLLKRARDGKLSSPKWKEIASAKLRYPKLFTEIPYLLADSRDDIVAFLGFRHVTGIMEWKPAEKAEYIAKMIEQGGMDYRTVTRKIGSKIDAVRRNYISYRLLLQMEDRTDIAVEHVEQKFSVLFLSLRTDGVRKYLDIDIEGDPKDVMKPVPKSKLKQLAYFALWLFGSDEVEPLFTDSRQVERFGRVLESSEAVQYLERTERPSFDYAHLLAGADEPELVKLVERAADNVEQTLARVHLCKKSRRLKSAAVRLSKGTSRLVKELNVTKEELES
jgi:hypothetical protein